MVGLSWEWKWVKPTFQILRVESQVPPTLEGTLT
jgi:hypothetical protein